MATSKRAKLLQSLYIQSLESKQEKKEDSYTDEERRAHQAWCFKNNITIYIQPVDYYQGVIVINEKGIISHGEHKYKTYLSKLKPKDEDWSKVIFRLYTQKFLENNNN